MELKFLSEYYMPIVLTACLIVGYCIKHITWLEKLSNEYIPAILAVIGSALAIISAAASGMPVSLETVVCGAFTGLTKVKLPLLTPSEVAVLFCSCATTKSF